MRSWTKSITNPLFSQALYYNDKRGSGALNTPAYNGNISGMDWTGGKGYNFTYDHLSRLTHADYLENNKGSSKYNTSYSYDKHGNMLTLSRNDNQSVSVDNLTFTYQGNQLMRTDDTGTDSTISDSMDFKDGENIGTDYAYDGNGNLTKDLNKNITDIEYNVLNLPSTVTFGDGNSVSYIYAADGRKLQTVHTINETTTTTDYVGNMIYENGTLKRILVDGGYYENGVYCFYIQDHLGNNRVVAKQDGSVVQMSDYYPYGMAFAESTSTGAQPYKYNGKELDTKGGLNLYDYGARHYDPALGRFMTVDPMAEKYYSISPYMYCTGNPTNLIDPDGKDVAILIAKDGAGGYGHMAAVIQDKDGNYFYMTVGNTDGRAATVSGISSGAGGGMTLTKIPFERTEATMEKAIEVAKTDKNNSLYTDNVVLKTSSKMDNSIFENANNLKKSFENGDTKYNAITNNCADAVNAVVKKGTGVSLPMGLSPKPNDNFKEIQKNLEDIQLEINKKIENEK